MTPRPPPHRILVVDDHAAIHEDFRKILMPAARSASLADAESVLFGSAAPAFEAAALTLDFAFQGQEALEKVRTSIATSEPYAVAFVDVRMPPGWDGIETIEQLWRVDPALEIVLCTAYSDYSWEKMTERLGVNANLVILKKPFDNIEVLQLAHALGKKWLVTRQAQLRLTDLDRMVSDRTRALEAANTALHRSEERFATAFRASPVALAIQSLEDDRFVDVNDAFVALAGFSNEELIDRKPRDIGLVIEFEVPVLSQLGGQPRLHGAAAKVQSKSGEFRQALVSLEPISLGGKPHVLLMVQDVSERMRLESQLRQAQKMEAIGQLAAGIAHDFNNLLTVIQGHTSLQLSDPHFGREVAESFEQIEQASERAAGLIRQLLTFSRRQIMQPRAVDLNELIRGVSAMLRRLLGETIELHAELEETLPAVFADPTGLEQILLNLAVNARDAMPRGGSITITTRACRAGTLNGGPDSTTVGHHVSISVADTGTGMDEQTRSRIFEPFFTTKDVHRGTGMGLATVYGIVTQHNGWIEVASAPQRGSTFHIYLPATDDLPEVARLPEPRLAVSLREHTILIAEDDESVRGLVKEILEQQKYRVFEAEHAEAAFRIWEEHRDDIELLLTDIVMPGEANGLELARQLLLDRPELKVIYTSGYSSELFGSDVELSEGLNYLPKPYLSSKLIAIVRRVLQPEESRLATVPRLAEDATAALFSA